jgi:aconitate hydratase
LEPGLVSYYDGLIKVDLSKVEPMIALPFHPSNVFSISELNKNAEEILKTVEAEGQKLMGNSDAKFNLTDKIVDGRIKVDQGIIAGCAGGTFENICMASEIISNHSVGSDYFNMSVYPASQPIYMELIKNGSISKLMEAGVTLKTAFCGPCFGAGDVPANNGLSIRHSTRNFPSREGSKPGSGQIASVALMDSLSIAATAVNGGILTPATEIDFNASAPTYSFNKEVYKNRIYNGFSEPKLDAELKYGPNIADWPKMSALTDNILLKMVSVINDPVTTTDELIPSGETSSYRSNPMKLAEFTLSRKDPQYVGRAVHELEKARGSFLENGVGNEELKSVFSLIAGKENISNEELTAIAGTTIVGSTIFAVKPGDGSAREQAASCQKVLGGLGNIAVEYATKRYRSNLINWGILPLTVSDVEKCDFQVGDYVYIEGIREAVLNGNETVKAYIINEKSRKEIILQIQNLTADEREIILAGSLINYYAAGKSK